jgi:PAS domain S-box-containing protein
VPRGSFTTSGEGGSFTTLRDSEERFRLMVESVRDYAIFMLDADGTVATWNPGAERFKGYTATEVIGAHVSLFYAPEDVATGRPGRELATAAREGRFEDEHWCIRKGGARFWAHVTINAVHGLDGSLVGFAKITRDVTERRRATEQFRLAIEAASTGMLMVDRIGTIVLVNAETERLFGYTREELVGRPIEVLVPHRFRGNHPSHRSGFLSSPVARPMGGGRDLYAVRRDGSEIAVEIGLNPLQMSDAEFVLASVVDITERKRRTSELTMALREREVLLQEVHHRVKNNLQIISSLINMQMRNTELGPSRDALSECQTRVQAIALIHEQLYQSKDYARVPFADYVRLLANNVFVATGVSPTHVQLELATEDVALAVDKAIPCGLVLNELITNALKHAFRDGRTGTVKVGLSRVDEAHCRLTVADDGAGFPPGSDVWSTDSLGLQLVRMLGEQLEAEVVTVTEGGAAFHLTFPVAS